MIAMSQGSFDRSSNQISSISPELWTWYISYREGKYTPANFGIGTVKLDPAESCRRTVFYDLVSR